MSVVNARILIWGITGSGKSTTLRTIHAKLREDLRGEILQKPTRLDPSMTYESLSIRLGEVGGVGTEIEIISVPSAPEDAMTRKQLLDEVDGTILAVDSSKERIEDNLESIAELRGSLAAYGQRLDAFPLVIQYNKRDIADPFAIEDLHRRIELPEAAVFETIATTGHGILATLTTISKNVVRARRNTTSASAPPTPAVNAADPVQGVAEEIPSAVDVIPDAREAAEAPLAAPADLLADDAMGSAHDILEAAILAEADDLDVDGLSESISVDFEGGTQPDWGAMTEEAQKPEVAGALRIVSAGQASVDLDGSLKLPLVLGDEGGQTRSVLLSLRLDDLASDLSGDSSAGFHGDTHGDLLGDPSGDGRD
ncbi:MAG: hypothetical protein AB8G23_17040 [Myxococcota bacterium]